MTTKFTATTAAELTADLADISSGADAATNTAYTIALAGNISLTSGTVNLQTGSSLTLDGPGAGLVDTFNVTGALIDATPITGTVSLDGGTLTTQALTDVGGVTGGGAVTGNVTGISATGDTVINDGSITDTDAQANGVSLVTGQVTNGAAASISAGNSGISISGAGTVINAGTVSAGYGVVMGSGDVTNKSQAAITGAGSGVVVEGAGNITNDGTITGGGDRHFGVYLNSGDVTNGSATDHAALIDATDGVTNTGIEIAAGTVSNFGTVGGHVAFGVVSFGSGTVTNYDGALIEGGSEGVVLVGTADVVNAGAIQSTGAAAVGVFFEAGGTLTNTASGTVNGSISGVAATGQSVTVTNSGAISGGVGVELDVGGTLSNGDATHTGASITGTGYYGVRVQGGAGSVTNFGTISGQVGISFYNSTLANAGIGTIVNAGTISSTYGITGTAVKFGTGAERLVVDKGAVFVGDVAGSGEAGSATTLEFASGSDGSLSGLDGTGGAVQQQSGSFAFSAIDTLAIDQGAAFTVSDTGQFGDVLVDGSITAEAGLTIKTVESLSTGVFDIAAAGTLDVTTDQAAGSAIDFAGAGGVLKIENVALFGSGAGTAGYTGPTIGDFAAGQTIDLLNLANAKVSSFDSAAGLLQLTGGGVNATLHLAGSFAGEFFHVGADTGAGTNLIVDGTPCYCRGTRILTPQGERPVEDLAIGDPVVTWSGQARPIRWIGRRNYGGGHPAPHPAVLPVLIRQGALADGLPRRDLLVSPPHAMFLEGVLVAARDLVNGASIVQMRGMAQIEYIHLELETHDVIFAEGAAAETFVDDASRGMFHNAADFEALYSDAPGPPPNQCAPRVEDGPALEAIRRAVAERRQATA